MICHKILKTMVMQDAEIADRTLVQDVISSDQSTNPEERNQALYSINNREKSFRYIH